MNAQRTPCTLSKSSLKQYSTIHTRQPQDSIKAELFDRYTLATEYLQFHEPELNSALLVLHNLLENQHLSTYPVLHAMIHVLMGIITPYSLVDNCRRKSKHINMAKEILKEEKHKDACQGCMFVEAKHLAGKTIDEDDGDDCVTLFRLEAVCGRESKAIMDWNWEGGDAPQRGVKVVKWADEDAVMQGVWD